MFGHRARRRIRGQQNYAHFTTRPDWENVLDEIFFAIAHFKNMGFAVISNTKKLHENDRFGTVMPHLNFRMGNQPSVFIQERLKRLSYTLFEQLFILKTKLEPDAYDCYHVRQSQALKNKLLYFLEQDKKRAILIFSLPLLHRQLNHHIQKINAILKGAERKIIAPMKRVPNPFPRKEYPNIKLQQLKTRLNYLEGKEHLTLRQVEESRDLREFVIRRMREDF